MSATLADNDDQVRLKCVYVCPEAAFTFVRGEGLAGN